MRISSTTFLAALAVQASADATPVDNNPVGPVYVATLPSTPFDKAAFPDGGNVVGSIRATAHNDGKGVDFQVSFSNLPTVDAGPGPFTYHIHAKPVPANGNCTATAGHLDPTDRGDEPACDKSEPATCQVGDLSGKHGKVAANATSFSASYTDLYASTLPSSPNFFGNLSFVFHYPNKTRITCANFVLESGSSSSSSSNSSTSTPSSTGGASASGSSTTSAPSTAVTAGANARVIPGLLAGAAGLFVYALL